MHAILFSLTIREMAGGMEGPCLSSLSFFLPLAIKTVIMRSGLAGEGGRERERQALLPQLRQGQ